MVKKEIAMHTLSEEERQTLIAIVTEQHGSAASYDVFADVTLGVFEDIPGFETMPPAKADHLVNELWSIYMAKKTTKPEPTETTGSNEDVPSPSIPSNPVVIDLNQPTIRFAIDQGKALIAEGKSKADAARLIFAAISTEPKEVIVAAFVEGATLTEKGALTYWYNCRRKAAKEAAAA